MRVDFELLKIVCDNFDIPTCPKFFVYVVNLKVL